MSCPSVVSRRHFVLGSFGVCLTATTGCGLILYPERRGQPRGRLDWGVVLLDGLGLLLFLVPGLIAFAVDFATGTIYLPPEYDGRILPPLPSQPLTSVRVPREQLTRGRIEQVASQHAGRPIRLVEGQYHTEPLPRIEDFWTAVARNV